MRDTSEYLELVGRVDGVILLNWHLNTLERQIEYGAQLGEVELAAAKVELGNFKKHVIPVAEFFDHKQILHLVTGDRKPDLVYTDFAKVFQKIVESDNRVGIIQTTPFLLPIFPLNLRFFLLSPFLPYPISFPAILQSFFLSFHLS